MVKGKQKESSFVSLISSKLSNWICPGRDDLLWKTSGSGSRFTIRSSKGLITENQSGDLTMTSSIAESLVKVFSIELKHYKEINIWSLITGSKEGICSFWEQTLRDSNLSKKLPFLIIRQNYKPVLSCFCNRVSYCILETFNKRPDVTSPKNKLFIFKLDDILSLPYHDFIEVISVYHNNIFRSYKNG